MCDVSVPRSISPGQKRRYHPQTVEIRDLQVRLIWWNKLLQCLILSRRVLERNLWKQCWQKSVQFCLSHCLFFFLLRPTYRSAPSTCICHHYSITNITVILLRRNVIVLGAVHCAPWTFLHVVGRFVNHYPWQFQVQNTSPTESHCVAQFYRLIPSAHHLLLKRWTFSQPITLTQSIWLLKGNNSPAHKLWAQSWKPNTRTLQYLY